MDLATLQAGTIKLGPQDTADCPFDLAHPFCQRAALLWNSSSLENHAPNAAPVSPTFDSSATFFQQDAIGRCVRKGTVDDGKGVNFGSYAPLQIGSGTFVFLFSIDSVSNYTNLFCNSQAGGAVGLLWRTNNAGKIELVHINTAVLYTGSIVLTAKALNCVAMSYNNATGTGAVAVNGKFNSNIAAAGFPRGFTYDTVRLCSSGVASFDGANRMWLAGVSPIVYPRDIVQSLSANPWQLLEEDVDLFVDLQSVAPPATGVVFRKSFSNIGGRVGARQAF